MEGVLGIEDKGTGFRAEDEGRLSRGNGSELELKVVVEV